MLGGGELPLAWPSAEQFDPLSKSSFHPVVQLKYDSTQRKLQQEANLL
jgi:hypothetical protein